MILTKYARLMVKAVEKSSCKYGTVYLWWYMGVWLSFTRWRQGPVAGSFERDIEL
jgi:hypothetical protein